MMYSSVIFYMLPVTSAIAVQARCSVSEEYVAFVFHRRTLSILPDMI